MGKQKPETVQAIAAAEANVKAEQENIESLKSKRADEIKACLAILVADEGKLQTAREALNVELAGLIGKPLKKQVRRPRVKGQKSLSVFISKVLKGRKKGLRVKDLCEKVLAMGYVSKSDNIAPMVNQALRDGPFVRLTRGVYAADEVADASPTTK